MDRDAFAGELDERGRLRPESDLGSRIGAAPHYLVFVSEFADHVAIESWKRATTSFFHAKLGLSVPRADPLLERVDAVQIMVHSGEVAGTRVCVSRPREDADVAVAERVESKTGATGLSALALRCGRVWCVESLARAEDEAMDRVSLLVSAILATVHLGPILTPARDELFGVRTARRKLEMAASPYR
jgi:hypothetical protein